MSLRSEVAAALQSEAERLRQVAATWPSRAILEQPREAVSECVAILDDAAAELVKPPAGARA
jgi:hypothetical protein